MHVTTAVAVAEYDYNIKLSRIPSPAPPHSYARTHEGTHTHLPSGLLSAWIRERTFFRPSLSMRYLWFCSHLCRFWIYGIYFFAENSQNTEPFLCDRGLVFSTFISHRWLITVTITIDMCSMFTFYRMHCQRNGMHPIMWYNYGLFASQRVKPCYFTEMYECGTHLCALWCMDVYMCTLVWVYATCMSTESEGNVLNALCTMH